MATIPILSMRSSIDRRYILGLTVRVCGVAGVLGFLMATAVGYLGANQADIQSATAKSSVPSISPSLVMFDQRQDRLDRSRQRAAKADMLVGPMPAPGSTHFLTRKQISTAEIPTASELNEPIHLAPWLEGETMTLSEVLVPEPLVPRAPDLLDARLPKPSLLDRFHAGSSQQGSRRVGSTVGTAGRAASGVAGKATGALGL
jgi:hypothetical protein